MTREEKERDIRNMTGAHLLEMFLWIMPYAQKEDCNPNDMESFGLLKAEILERLEVVHLLRERLSK